MSYDAPPPPPPGSPEQGGYAAQPAGTNGKATWSLVTGILGLCCGPLSIVAIVLGVIARKEIAASGGRQGGQGLATAGLVIGVIALALTILSVILYSTGVLTNPLLDGTTSP